MDEHRLLRAAMRTQIDGIPAYVGDFPGRTRAVLVFRVGQSDETLATRGLTHLIEHLALGRAARADVPSGHVGVTSTIVIVEGSPAEVVRGIQDAARGFASPPLDRLEVERRVLGAEDAAPAPAGADLYTLHFGARGPGLVAKRELGLRRITAHDVAAHAAAWFTRGNAALALSQPLPDLTELGLPAGARRPVPAHPLVRRRSLPGEVERDRAGTALGAPVPASDAAPVLRALLERLAWRVLRHERGLAYHVDCRAEGVSRDLRLLTLTTDARPADAGEVTRLLVEGIEAIARGDLTADELAGAQRDIARRLADEPLAALTGALNAELSHGRRRSPAEALDALAAVTADDVSATAGVLRDRLIAVLPPGRRSGVLDPLPDPQTPPVQGARLELTQEAGGAAVIVGDDGVTAVDHDGAGATVRFAECVAAVQEPDGAVVLIAPDDDHVVIDPRHVAGGAQVVARVLRAVPPDVVVPPDGELEPGRRPRAEAVTGTSTTATRVVFSRGGRPGV